MNIHKITSVSDFWTLFDLTRNAESFFGDRHLLLRAFNCKCLFTIQKNFKIQKCYAIIDDTDIEMLNYVWISPELRNTGLCKFFIRKLKIKRIYDTTEESITYWNKFPKLEIMNPSFHSTC